MKNRLLLNIIRILFFLICIGIILFLIIVKNLRESSNQILYTKIDSIDYSKELIINQEELTEEKHIESLKLKEYENIEEYLGGFKVVGKIECEKINLSQYILEETTDKSLNVSVTKLYGPQINTVGNFCIIGHNYINSKMFGDIKKLEVGDLIKITDTYNRSLEYKIYSIYTTNPKDVSCLSQETEGEREITLITCTFTGVNRLIIKASENYD